MPGPRKLKITDPVSGDTVRVLWHSPADPTDADINDILSSYKSQSVNPNLQAQAEASKQFNAAQAAQMAQAGQQRIQQKYAPWLYPYTEFAKSSLGKSLGANPTGGAIIDALAPGQIFRGIVSAANTEASAFHAPDTQTGILRGVRGLGQGAMAGLTALHPIGFSEFGGSTEAVNQAFPSTRPIAEAIGSPTQSFFKPQTPFGQELAQTADVGVGLGAGLAASAVSKALADRQAFKAQFPTGYDVEKGTQYFAKGVPRNPSQGGIRAQVRQITPIDSYLSEAYKNGLPQDPNLSPSERVQKPIKDLKQSIFQDELDATKRHPNDRVPVTPGAGEKMLQLGRETGNESKYAEVKKMLDQGGNSLTLPQTLQTLVDLNADTRAFSDVIDRTGQAPSPSSKANLNDLRSITGRLRADYLQRMADVGETGVKENRIAYGALDEMVRDIEAKKNAVDQLPQSFWERNVQKRGTSLSGRVLDNLTQFLRKTPADYLARAAREWQGKGLTAPRIQSNPNAPKGLLPSPINPAGTIPPNPNFFGPQLPPRTVPENFIRGAGEVVPSIGIRGQTPEDMARIRELYPNHRFNIKPPQDIVPENLQKIGVEFDGINPQSGLENYTDTKGSQSTFTRRPGENVQDALLRHRREWYGKK